MRYPPDGLYLCWREDDLGTDREPMLHYSANSATEWLRENGGGQYLNFSPYMGGHVTKVAAKPEPVRIIASPPRGGTSRRRWRWPRLRFGVHRPW